MMRRYDWYGGEDADRNADLDAEAVKARAHGGLVVGCGLMVMLAVVAIVVVLALLVTPIFLWVHSRH